MFSFYEVLLLTSNIGSSMILIYARSTFIFSNEILNDILRKFHWRSKVFNIGGEGEGGGGVSNISIDMYIWGGGACGGHKPFSKLLGGGGLAPAGPPALTHVGIQHVSCVSTE